MDQRAQLAAAWRRRHGAAAEAHSCALLSCQAGVRSARLQTHAVWCSLCCLPAAARTRDGATKGTRAHAAHPIATAALASPAPLPPALPAMSGVFLHFLPLHHGPRRPLAKGGPSAPRSRPSPPQPEPHSCSHVVHPFQTARLTIISSTKPLR